MGKKYVPLAGIATSAAVAAALGGACGGAWAADVSAIAPSYAKLPAKAAPARALINWTGCYLGVHAGGATQNDTSTSFADHGGFGGGALAGGQAGCDYRLGQLVVGVEGEGAWANLVDKSSIDQPGQSVAFTARNRWSADVALRAGVAVGQALVFGKVGAARGRFDISGSVTGTLTTNASTLSGLLLGGGIEYAFAPQWSAKLEYDHIDYVGRVLRFDVASQGVRSSFNLSESAGVNMVKVGVNHRFAGDASFAAGDASAPSPLFTKAAHAGALTSPNTTWTPTWTGCYLGVHAGGATQNDPFTNISTLGLSAGSIPLFDGGGGFGGGALAGGQAGCDYRLGQLVVGVEGEGTWSDLVDKSSFDEQGFFIAFATRNRWSADVALRAGVAVGQGLLYGKVGAARGGFDFSTNIDGLGTGNGDGTLSGLLLGGGIEYALAPQWSAKLEYDHIDYVGRVLRFDQVFLGVPSSFNQSESAGVNMVKVGVNHRFGDTNLDASFAAADASVPSPFFTKAARALTNWTGCYLGVHAGGATQNDTLTNFGAGGGGGGGGGGALAGGQAGCNYQLGQIVVGVEGEGAWANLVDKSSFDQPGISDQLTARNRWSADVALRAGVAVGQALVFGKVGAARGRFDFCGNSTGSLTETENANGTLSGLLLGGGIEYAFAPQWSAKLEYDHIDYVGRELRFDQVFLGVPSSFNQSESAGVNMVKLGVNHRFGAPDVVTAKY